MSEDGTDWAGLRVRDGVGMDPGPIRDMLRAPDSGSGDEAYWRIEGTAFYSHELFEATEPLTQILVDAVCDGDGTPLGARARHGHARGDHLRLHLPPRGGGRQCRSGRPVPGHRAPPPAPPVPAGGGLGPLSETRPAAQSKHRAEQATHRAGQAPPRTGPGLTPRTRPGPTRRSTSDPAPSALEAGATTR